MECICTEQTIKHSQIKKKKNEEKNGNETEN